MQQTPDTDTKALPATPRQIQFARSLAMKNGTILPWDVLQSRRDLSAWIDQQVKLTPMDDQRPTSKQVAFAERIAKIRRIHVPDECYRDTYLLSRWINSHKH